MPELTALTEAEEIALEKYAAEKYALSLSTQPIDIQQAQVAINGLYDLMKESHPKVTKFPSIFSMLDSFSAHERREAFDAMWLSPWHYIGFLSVYDFPRKHIAGFKYEPETERELDAWIAALEALHGFIPMEGECYVSERPVAITVDAQGRLHSTSGAALAYEDGEEVHAYHNIVVPKRIIEEPLSITAEEVLAETNQEIRRAMVAMMGAERFVKISGAKKVHEDDCGVLYRLPIPGDEDVVIVKVVNSTPEPDGSYRDYFLRVNPELRPLLDDNRQGEPQKILTARGAVASTFGLTADAWLPNVET